VVTGKEDDAQAALTAETSLRDAIDQSMRGTTNPTRLEQITRLAREFRIFTRIFADILRIKRESALVAQNQLARGANMLRYKLDDLPSNADDAELPVIEFGAKKSQCAISGRDRARQYFCHQRRPGGCRQRGGASQVCRKRAARNSSTNEKIIRGP
jgi:hypothetical protein